MDDRQQQLREIYGTVAELCRQASAELSRIETDLNMGGTYNGTGDVARTAQDLRDCRLRMLAIVSEG